MTRSKVKLAYISNNSVRRATFKKRRKGLLKKLDELTTLCGIKGCAVVCESKNDSQPVFWPSETEVQSLLRRFHDLSKMDQSNKMFNQRSFLEHMIKKAQDKLAKTMRANKEKEIALRVHEYAQSKELSNNLSVDDLNDIARVNDEKMKEMEMEMELEEIEKKDEEGMEMELEEIEKKDEGTKKKNKKKKMKMMKKKKGLASSSSTNP